MPPKKTAKPAKEVSEKPAENLTDLTLQATLAAIEGRFGKGSIMLAGVNDTTDVERISFGHPDLDDMTNGGLPRGRITVLVGEPGGGKTTAALTAIGNAQKMGLRAALIDTEHVFEPDYAQCLGVDTDALLISQPQSAEQALDIYDMLVKSGAVGIIVLDSVAATSTNAEIEGSMADQQRGDKARLFSKATRKLVKPVAATNTAAIFINQWRDDAGGYGGGKQMPAGRGLKYASSLILDFARKETLYKTKGGDKVPTGQISVVKAIRSKVSLPFQKREIELKFPEFKDKKMIPGSGGYNVYAAVINHALDSGRLVQNKAWFALPQPDGTTKNIAQGRDKLIALLQQDEKLLKELSA